MAELVGQRLGRYQVQALLGTGALAQVFRGVEVPSNRPVAIKVMSAQLVAIPGFQARFHQEMQAVAALRHPQIVEISDFGEQGGHFYLAMELMTGGSLRVLLHQQARARRPGAWLSGLDLVRQAADGLAYAHSQGMVHGDVRPENLLLNPLGSSSTGDDAYTVKVSDFGLARLATGGATLASGLPVSTLTYTSPEQCLGLDVDGRIDIYSLGIILYEMATGYLPF